MLLLVLVYLLVLGLVFFMVFSLGLIATLAGKFGIKFLFGFWTLLFFD